MRNLILYHEDDNLLYDTACKRLAEEFGEDFMGTTDVFVWDIPFGLSMDDLRGMTEHLTYAAVTLPQLVVIVRNAERLSEMCQGALLTELENDDVCFVICSRLPLLSTIESRCDVVKPADKTYSEDFYKYAGTDDLPKAEEQMLRQMVGAFRKKDRAYEVLMALRMYKEKDKESFFSLYKEESFIVFRLLKKLFEREYYQGDLKAVERIRGCSIAEAKYLRTLPTANEFNAALYVALA